MSALNLRDVGAGRRSTVSKRRLRNRGGVGRTSPHPSGRRGKTRLPSHAGRSCTDRCLGSSVCGGSMMTTGASEAGAEGSPPACDAVGRGAVVADADCASTGFVCSLGAGDVQPARAVALITTAVH